MTEANESSVMREQLERQERRITELEIEAAFRRQASDDLDEVVRGQDQRIARLEQRIAELVTSLESVSD